MFAWHILFCKYYSISSLHIQLKRISVQQCCYCKSDETLKICNRRFEIPVQTSITLVETQILQNFFNMDYFNNISCYCLWERSLVFQFYPKTITNLLHNCFNTSCVTGFFFPPNSSSILYHTIQRKWSPRSFHRPDTDCMSQWDFKAKGQVFCDSFFPYSMAQSRGLF